MSYKEIKHFSSTFFNNEEMPSYRVGSAAYGLTFGQDGNFPFPYDPVTDTYLAWRWDYEEPDAKDNIKAMRPELTQDVLKGLQGLYLTSHPRFYESPWVTGTCRLTQFNLKLPRYMMHEDVSFHKLFSESWDNDPRNAAVISPKATLKVLMDQGIDGHINTPGAHPPEMMLMNPSKYIVSAVWAYSHNVTAKKINTAEFQKEIFELIQQIAKDSRNIRITNF